MRVLFFYPDYSPAGFVTVVEKLGYYSEGIGTLTAALKNDGNEVRVLHQLNRDETGDFRAVLDEYKPDLLAISSRTTVFPDAVRVAEIAQSAGIKTVIGGIHPTIAPDEAAEVKFFDFICIGEGEAALSELCSALKEGRDPTGIESIWARDGDRVIKNPVRPLVNNLDELPFPDYSVFDAKRMYGFALGEATAILSRGCPYDCTYCCNHAIKNAYPKGSKYTRFRSPENSIAYLKNLLDNFPDTKRLEFVDDILPLNKKWFAEFISLYREEINRPFACCARVDLINEDVIELLSSAGCKLVHFGVESGDEELRRQTLNRPLSDDQIATAFDLCRNAGIATLSYNMVGLPYENKKRFLKTIKLNARIKPFRSVLAVFYPYPHTAAHAIAARGDMLLDELKLGSAEYLKQPGFPTAQIKFCVAYFRFFITLYRLCLSAGAFGKIVAKIADIIYSSPLLPHRLLAFVGKATRRTFHRMRGFIRRTSPSFYNMAKKAAANRYHKKRD